MSIWFWFWVVIAAVLIVLEIFTAGFFMLPFGIGAAAAALLEWVLPGSVGWQWLTFIAVSAALLVALRRFAERITHEPPVKVGVDRVLGKSALVIEQLDSHSSLGRVRVGTEEWRAETPDGTSLPLGARVVVERIDGTHLIVTPTEEARAASGDTEKKG